MIVVIQCAASKRSGAGHLLSAAGKPVSFVADPDGAPTDASCIYARPDDPSETRLSWRQALRKYNEEAGTNPLGLYPPWQLYQNRTYGRFVDPSAWKRSISSAGWGLIRADFLTPYYDITFSASADNYKRRRKTDRYQDFRMLCDETDEVVVFFGGKDYLPLFCALTDTVRARRTLFYRSAHVPPATGCVLKRFETDTLACTPSSHHS
jgi:hypothetical protein